MFTLQDKTQHIWYLLCNKNTSSVISLGCLNTNILKAIVYHILGFYITVNYISSTYKISINWFPLAWTSFKKIIWAGLAWLYQAHPTKVFCKHCTFLRIKKLLCRQKVFYNFYVPLSYSGGHQCCLGVNVKVR